MLLTDADEVLLQWMRPFGEFIKKKGIKTFSEEPLTWALSEWIDHPNVVDLVNEFNSSEHFEKLDAMPGSIEVIKKISKSHEIVVITSCGDGFEKARVKNLTTLYGENTFKDIICLPLGMKKHDILGDYSPSYWIDDNFQNALAGSENGHFSMLFNRTYNKDMNHESLTRVFNWQEIESVISSNGNK